MNRAQKNCLECGNLFTPRRSDQDFDRRGCARTYRKTKVGPLPGKGQSIPPHELAAFAESMRRARPPRTAIGYKLYCAELLIWLPLPGTARFDGNFPKGDYFELFPTETPRVPLATNYRLAWVYPGGIVKEIDHTLFVCFPSDMRRAGEVGRRVRAYEAQRRLPALASAQPQLLLGQHEQGHAASDGETKDDA